MKTNLINHAKDILSCCSAAEIYEDSYYHSGNCDFLAVNADGKDLFLFRSDEDMTNAFDPCRTGRNKLFEFTHQNRLILNRVIPYTVPAAAGREKKSFGLGDRLGNAGCGHLKALRGNGYFPILAQQSKRELTLTARTLDDVIDAAAWSVLKSGYTDGYGADGDHLKTYEDIEFAIKKGCSMITLDCSDVLKEAPDSYEVLKHMYEAIPRAERTAFEDRYLHAAAPVNGLSIDLEKLMRIAVCYHESILLAEKVYHGLIKGAGRSIDFELSLDETAFVTSAEAHFVVANELLLKNVLLTSLAPRFVGEFQKGIDYIGDVNLFRNNYAIHAQVAKYFGHKLSIHSGSDKFRIFPVIGQETPNQYHIKTSGTSWLEAVRVIAGKDPELYRIMHTVALEHFDEAKQFYHISGSAERIRPLYSVEDAALSEYLTEDNARQLLHITYGYLLNHDAVKIGFKKDMDLFRTEYTESLRRHFSRHIQSLTDQ